MVTGSASLNIEIHDRDGDGYCVLDFFSLILFTVSLLRRIIFENKIQLIYGFLEYGKSSQVATFDLNNGRLSVEILKSIVTSYKSTKVIRAN